MNKQEYTKLFIILGAINITCLLISNIVTIKTINIFGLVFAAGDILFPITYILNDILTEVYGFRKARLTIWLSFFCNLIMVLVFLIILKIPADSSFHYQNELEIVLGMTPRLLIASFIAYIIGSFVNSITMSKLKVRMKGKYLPLRAIASTALGACIDTIIFVPIAFLGRVDLSVMVSMMINVFCLKVLFEIVLTPVTYKVIKEIKRREQIDVFDHNETYRII
ncbi:MAG: queuosine precursor transporter [Oscillospiraceae bacterium]|nr:queuosine precursor transporter [Oscillospiraceae bacterium]